MKTITLSVISFLLATQLFANGDSTKTVQQFVVKKTKPENAIVKPAKPAEIITPTFEKIDDAPRAGFSGIFNYSLTKEHKVLLAIFDEDNKIKKMYVNNQLKGRGDYTYLCEISGEEMGDRKCFLRLYYDGKLQREKPIE